MAQPLQLAGPLVSVFQVYLSPILCIPMSRDLNLSGIGDDKTGDA